MRLNNSNHEGQRGKDSKSGKDQAEARRISISRMVQDLVLSLGDHLASSHITVDLDIQPLEAVADPSQIQNAMKGLVRNALRAMPRGGELSVTLIDGPYQWELEVADTSTNRFVEEALASATPDAEPGNETSNSLASQAATPVPDAAWDNEDLAVVQRVADAHGGQLQTWNCPLGGTANVLVIPRRHKNAA